MGFQKGFTRPAVFPGGGTLRGRLVEEPLNQEAARR